MNRDTLALMVVGAALFAALLVAAALIATAAGVEQDASDDRFDSIGPTVAPAEASIDAGTFGAFAPVADAFATPVPIADSYGVLGTVGAYSSKGSSGS